MTINSPEDRDAAMKATNLVTEFGHKEHRLG